MQKEIWLDAKGFKNYQVSNLGGVRTVDRMVVTINGITLFKKQIILKPSKNKSGYLYVKLFVNGKRKHMLVHRLVGLTFLENPLNKPQINHIDCVKHNNCVENLEWTTNSENRKHAQMNGLYDRPLGYKYGPKAIMDRANNKCYRSISEAARDKRRSERAIRQMIKDKEKNNTSLEYCESCD